MKLAAVATIFLAGAGKANLLQAAIFLQTSCVAQAGQRYRCYGIGYAP
jgi:hypothetical protein